MRLHKKMKRATKKHMVPFTLSEIFLSFYNTHIWIYLDAFTLGKFNTLVRTNSANSKSIVLSVAKVPVANATTFVKTVTANTSCTCMITNSLPKHSSLGCPHTPLPSKSHLSRISTNLMTRHKSRVHRLLDQWHAHVKDSVQKGSHSVNAKLISSN